MSNFLDYNISYRYKRQEDINESEDNYDENDEHEIDDKLDDLPISYYRENYNRRHRKKNKQIQLANSNKFVFMFMYFYNITYLWSESLQTSVLVSQQSHYKNTVSTFAYNYLFINIICYGLFKFSDITVKKNVLTGINLFLYFLFNIIGGLGFALLGELDFFKHFAIVKGFWENLDPRAVAIIIFFTVTISLLTLREIIDSIKIKQFKKQLFALLLLASLYSGVLFYLKQFGATNIHYHVHHAIFSCVLSLFFLNWENKIEMITHSIFLGVLIEGINFYGIGELYLFLSDIGPEISFLFIAPFTVIITTITSGAVFVFYYVYQTDFKFKRSRV